MATALGDVFVRIGAKTKGFEKGLDKIQSQSAKVFAGVSAAITGIGMVGSRFEKNITKVGALTAATGEQFQRLSKHARNVAKETEFTAAQAADAMGFFAMAGYDAEQAMAALRPTTMLASSGFTDLARAGDIVTNISAGMGIGFDGLNDAVDTLVATATSANVTVDMLGESFSYGAPALHAFGFSIHEVAAAFGIMGDAGIQGSRAGTNLAMAMVKLAKPMDNAKAIIAKYGLEVFGANKKMRSMSEIFGDVVKSGMTATEMLTVFGPRGGRAALVIAKSMKSAEKNLTNFTEALKNSGGRAEEIWNKTGQTIDFQFKVMKSNMEEAVLVLYDSLRPALMSIIQIVQGLARAFSNLSPQTVDTITSFLGLTAVGSGFVLVGATIAKVMLLVVKGLVFLGGVLVPVGTAFAAATTAAIGFFGSLNIGSVITLVAATAQKIYAATTAFLSAVVTVATTRITLMGLATALTTKIMFGITAAARAVVGSFALMGSAFALAKAGVVALGGAFTLLGNLWVLGSTKIIAATAAMYSAIFTPVAAVAAVFVAFGASMALLIYTIIKHWDGLVYEFTQGVAWLEKILGIPADYMEKAFGDTFKNIKQWFSDLLSTFAGGINKVGGWLKSMGIGALEFVGIEVGGPAKEAGTGAGATGTEDKRSAITKTFDAVKGWMEAVFEKLGISTGDATDTIKTFETELARIQKGMGQVAEGTGKANEEIEASAGQLADAIAAGPPFILASIQEWERTAPDLSKYAGSLSDELYLAWTELSEPLQAAAREALSIANAFDLSGVIVEKAILTLASGIQTAAGVAVRAIQQNVGGDIGGVIQAGIQGGMAGGPIGAIVGVIMEVVMAFESIVDSIAVADEGLKMIGDVASPIFDSLVSMNEGINESLGGMLEALQPLFSMLTGIVEIFTTVFGAFIKAINAVIEIAVGALTPALDLLATVFETVMNVIEPILDMFIGLLNVVASVITGVGDLLSSLDLVTWIFKGLGELAKGFKALMQGPIEWIENAANDIGKAFDDAVREVDNAVSFMGRGFRNLTDAEKEATAAAKEAALANLAMAEEAWLNAQAIQEFGIGIDALIQQFVEANRIQDMTTSELSNYLDNTIDHALTAGQTAEVFEDVYNSLLKAGDAPNEALAKISAALVAGSEIHAEAFKILSDSTDWGDFIGPLGRSMEGLTDAVNEATDSLLNIPAGFKMEYFRLASIETTGTAGSAFDSDFPAGVAPSGEDKSTQVIVQGDVHVNANNVDEFMETWDNITQDGTAIGTSTSPEMEF